ncbi:NAD-dependent epimerase/dehydratase family protein [Rohdeia mirabilis]|uniref:NAD-dependent epimerase/dehydratase family protein n=1 Tax=Rohdeia mirabilis TaxID=2528008 RepID=UPI003AF3C1A1
MSEEIVNASRTAGTVGDVAPEEPPTPEADFESRPLARRSPATILVTGGEGFIGSVLVRELARRGHRVRVLDDLSGANVSRATAGGAIGGGAGGDARGPCEPLDGVQRFVGSVADPGTVARAMRDCDTVVHLAAVVGVRRVLRDPEHTLRINWDGARTVATEAHRCGARLLFASSSEVLGPGATGSAAGFRLAEGHRPLAGIGTSVRWSYAVAKLAGERLVHELANGPDPLRGRSVRFFNTTGPGQSPTSGMVLPVLVARGLAGRTLEVHGSGEQVRSFCHVDDTVRALVGLLEARDLRWDGGVHHVGSEEAVTVGELARRVGERLGVGVEHVAYERVFGPGFEDVHHRVPDTAALRAAIGWEPRIGLDALIDDVIEHQRRTLADAGARNVRTRGEAAACAAERNEPNAPVAAIQRAATP